MDPVVAVWIALALNCAGVLLMVGAKRQQINDLLKRVDEHDEDIDRVEREKLAVDDYRREAGQIHARIGDVDKRAEGRTAEVTTRVVRLEERAFGAGGGHRR